jgi:hypothetical protein
MTENRKDLKADVMQGVIVGDVGKVTQNYSASDEGKTSEGKTPGVPVYIWIPALIFTAILIFFMIAAFFIAPTMTSDQRNVLHLLFCLLAGFSTTFLGGSVLMKVDMPVGTAGKMMISATAGVAIFIFVYLRAPFWFGQ